MSEVNSNSLCLSIKDVSAGYNKREVLHNISFEINKNEIVALVGPNGAGKSTILKVIYGLLEPTAGCVIFEEKNITNNTSRRNVQQGIGFSIQGGRTFTDLTVLENLQISFWAKNGNSFNKQLKNILTFFPKLDIIKHKRAGLLSGGEKQMLSLAMLLINQPKLLLLDEPSSGLAPNIADEIISIIKRISETFGTTVLLVEQNINLALKIAQRVCLLKDGKVFAVETPEEFYKNKTYEKLFLR